MRSQRDRPTFPGLEEHIGYDPARFLSTSMDPMPMLRGIDDLGVANAWVQAARDMDPSEGTKRAIERRRDELLEAQ